MFHIRVFHFENGAIVANTLRQEARFSTMEYRSEELGHEIRYTEWFCVDCYSQIIGRREWMR